MSNRQPSRSTVRLMPPTTESDSSTVDVMPYRVDQLVGGGEPGRAGADDDDVRSRVRGGFGGFGHEAAEGSAAL